MKQLLVIATGVMCFACSNDPWNGEEKAAFMENCLENKTSAYCNCYMEKAMSNYPRYEDYENMSFEEAVEISEQCEE